MSKQTRVQTASAALRWSVIAGIAAVALLGSYAFAATRGESAQAATPAAPAAQTVSSPAAASTSGGCACCGGSSTPAGPATTGQAATSAGVQKISVDVSKGYYDPSVIELKAGVPAEITFSQSSGCTGIVQSTDLGFSEDLSGGPVTVKLQALTPGTYGFACGMNMVTGSIVVK